MLPSPIYCICLVFKILILIRFPVIHEHWNCIRCTRKAESCWTEYCIDIFRKISFPFILNRYSQYHSRIVTVTSNLACSAWQNDCLHWLWSRWNGKMRNNLNRMEMYRVNFVLLKVLCSIFDTSFIPRVSCYSKQKISYTHSHASIARMFCHHLEATAKKRISCDETTNIFTFKCIPNWKHSLVDWWFSAFI